MFSGLNAFYDLFDSTMLNNVNKGLELCTGACQFVFVFLVSIELDTNTKFICKALPSLHLMECVPVHSVCVSLVVLL